ncbi:MAG: 3-deoxy-8-phosphooctulonate synthase [Lachnospiraceae bacterium]
MILIAGPCVIESEEIMMEIAAYLKRTITNYTNLEFYFKASFDKANRTSIDSFRGPGIDEGLRILNKVREIFDLKICTDIHEPWQAETVARISDMIQIPAFLCRQTDLLTAAAKTGKTINIKKAQFLAPWDMKNVVRKVACTGNKKIILCERGTSFGYNQLIVDMSSFFEMKKNGYPVIFDATHSVQKPGGNGSSTGGNRDFIEPLAKAAIAAGADGLFFEVHPDPEHALSDGSNMLKLDEFSDILEKATAIHRVIHMD